MSSTIQFSNSAATDVVKLERIGAHSHIQGLGLNELLECQESCRYLVGQHKARRALGVILKLIRAGQILKIEVLDHVIVGAGRHTSLRELGLWYQ